VEGCPFAAVTVLDTTEIDGVVVVTFKVVARAVVEACVVVGKTKTEVRSAVSQYCV
jgi:hypothetical protein